MGLLGPRPVVSLPVVCAEATPAAAAAQTNAYNACLMLDDMFKSTLPQPA
jgi:hypothetical protein